MSSPEHKKPQQIRLKVKTILTFIFGCWGLVCHEFIPRGQTVNKKSTWPFYSIYQKQCERNSGNSGRNIAGFSTTLLWCTKKPPQSYLTKNATPEVPQICYSPAFSPLDLFLFPKWKVNLEGLKFQSAKEIWEKCCSS